MGTIWSIEHNAWWAPARRGYAESKAEAGRYPLTEAMEIVADANKHTTDRPNEAMVYEE